MMFRDFREIPKLTTQWSLILFLSIIIYHNPIIMINICIFITNINTKKLLTIWFHKYISNLSAETYLYLKIFWKIKYHWLFICQFSPWTLFPSFWHIKSKYLFMICSNYHKRFFILFTSSPKTWLMLT